MSLADTQRLIALLATDASLRTQLLSDPLAVAARYGVDAKTAQTLAKEIAEEIERFARSLIGKRRNEVCKLLPRTKRVLGNCFDDLFRLYAKTTLPNGTKKHLQDAVQFADFLHTKLAAEKQIPLWIAELARYEASWLEVRTHPCLLIRGFRALTKETAHLEANPSLNPALRPRRTLALWLRLPGKERIYHTYLTLF